MKKSWSGHLPKLISNKIPLGSAKLGFDDGERETGQGKGDSFVSAEVM